ncbi:putative mitochondrion protein [Filobasidium floriforme]|uniref:putative mitochondrion protein n=1 Tax=Filobasidium floriforme TaxID=5210 RepID=UPI001E8E456C|nr:putative mitochondrion protein [Filobasidium floriforme]KAH8088613.1 putative mitochondrion protein [Filobasidium floriforme]
MASYNRLVRFIPKSTSTSTSASTSSDEPLIGEPCDPTLDVGLASYNSQPIHVSTFTGSSVLSPGQRTGEKVMVGRILSPLSEGEVGTIRCIGLNYINHAKEVGMDIPIVPTLFMKPATALADPYPAPTVIPKAFVGDQAADYEAEFVIVIGHHHHDPSNRKVCKDVSEENAMDYVAGYTAANDLSSRKRQFETSQWGFSKGFDGACPIGPAFIPKEAVGGMGDAVGKKGGLNLKEVTIRGARNGVVCQDSTLDDLIFSVPKIVAFLSQGTTLRPGTIILTGTPAGVGWSSTPKNLLQDGDEFSVYVSHGVGTLINKIQEEK